MEKLLKIISRALEGILFLCVILGFIGAPCAYFTDGVVKGTEIAFGTGLFSTVLWFIIEWRIEENKND